MQVNGGGGARYGGNGGVGIWWGGVMVGNVSVRLLVRM